MLVKWGDFGIILLFFQDSCYIGLVTSQSHMTKQTTNTVLMIRPKNFGVNLETVSSNAFQPQTAEGIDAEQIKEQARREFDELVQVLRDAGVKVVVVEDTDDVVKPDAVFLNNWITFYDGGKVVFHPMNAESRRLERRHDVIDKLKESGVEVNEVIDFSEHEKEGKFLEGAGSMTIDRRHNKIYACESPRTDRELVEKFANKMGFTAMIFKGEDEQLVPIYHTSMMMVLGDRFAVVCLDAVTDRLERKRLREELEDTGHEIVDISIDQMHHFAGNIIQLENESGEQLLVMSRGAYGAFEKHQIAILEKFARLLVVDVSTIEMCSGASVNGMMADVF